MLNNQLVDSELLYPRRSWIIDNARIKGTQPLQLTSSKDNFGMHQKLYLKKKGRYYFRVNVSALKSIKEAIIGVEIEGKLQATKYFINVNTTKCLSVIVDVKDVDKPVTLYVICTTRVPGASITVEKPVFYNLDELWLRFALKMFLDWKLEYSPSLSYDNILTTATLSTRNISYKPKADTLVFPANTGEIVVSTKSSINIQRRCNLQHNHKYLLKILKEEVNNQGSVRLTYNGVEGKVLSKAQQYITFIYDGRNLPVIECKAKANNKIDYRVILKKLLLIDMSGRQDFEEEEIKSLLFVE